jgi:Trp operon repressor
MSRVSKFKVDPYLESLITNQFWNFLGKVSSSKVSSDFFNDFLTSSEKTMLAKRFATLVLLSRNKTPTEIQNSIHVTFSTIGAVSAWLKNAKDETQKLLQKISKEKDWEAVFDKIDDVLDKIPPRRHSDWKEEYSTRRKESLKRSAKKSLR